MNERAQLRRSCGVILIGMLIAVSASCTSRVVYEPPAGYTQAADAININTASAEELERLPYIGPKTAENIIRFREENGPFRRPEHLMQIHGVSERRFLAIRTIIRTE